MKISDPIPENILKRLPDSIRKKMGKAGMTIAEALSSAEAKSERQLQDQIASLLTRSGVWFARQRMDRKSNLRVGTPDFLLCVDGKFVAWEVKLPSGATTLEQDHELEEIKKCGGTALVIRSYREAMDSLGKLG